MPFLNEAGLWALLALIPFIILYLRKPKPVDRTIPSLMFIMQNQKTSKRYNFLRRFLTNLLFFIQLLALIGMSFAVAEPFITVPYDVSRENTVIILDVSASMQTKINSNTRFDEAIQEASNSLSGSNTIILAEHIPITAVEGEDVEVASNVLQTLQPKSTTTNIRDAMLLAQDILGDSPGRILVISDFNQVDASDLLVVKRRMSSEEVIVEFVDVSEEAENIGITDLDVKKHSIKVFVKNFNGESREINLKLVKDGKTIAESGNIEVLRNSVETFVFDNTPTGVSEIRIEPEDDLMVDNTAFISAPLKKTVSVLLITNEANTNVENALRASRDVSLNVVNPPVLTLNTAGERIEPFQHDVIVAHEINNVGQRNGILPGTFQDLSNYARDGGKVILTAQEDLAQFKTEDIGIVGLKDLVEQPSKVCAKTINELTKEFENNKCFATVTKHFNSATSSSVKVMATAENDPMLALGDVGKGKVFFYGIIDKASDFPTLPSYPIFWNALVNFIAGTEDIDDFNTKTGRVVTIEEQKVKTPTSSVTTSKLIIDEAGIYEYSNKRVAANLLDEKESSVTKKSELESAGASAEVLKEKGVEQNFSLSPLILIAVFALLLMEVFYVKSRGDL